MLPHVQNMHFVSCKLAFTLQPVPYFLPVMQASEDALDLLSKMMQLNPARRLTVEQLLQHR